MPRRRLLLPAVVFVVAAAFVPLAAAPAGAGVHKRKALATHVLPCNDGSGKVARAWYPWRQKDRQYKSWAADNPCRDQWLIFNLPGDSVSDPYGTTLNVGPGRSFHRSSQRFTADSDSAVDAYLYPRFVCGEYDTYKVERSGRFKWVRC